MYFDIQEQLVKYLNKMDEIMELTKGGKILIAANTNSGPKTWHDLITNTTGKKTGGVPARVSTIYNKRRERKYIQQHQRS